MLFIGNLVLGACAILTLIKFFIVVGKFMIEDSKTKRRPI